MNFPQNGEIRTRLLQEVQNGFAKIENNTLRLSNITQIRGWFMQWVWGKKKAWDKITDKVLHLCGGRQNLCTKRQMWWTWIFKDFWERFLKFWKWLWKWKRIFQKCYFGNAIFHENEKMRISLQKSAYTAENDESLLKTHVSRSAMPFYSHRRRLRHS